MISRRRSWLGFTLIELLVVISIIALLISLLLPSLGRAKEAAINVQCLSNLHGQGIAWHQYGADNKQMILGQGDNTWVNGFPFSQSGSAGISSGTYILWQAYTSNWNGWNNGSTLGNAYGEVKGYGYNGMGFTWPYVGGGPSIAGIQPIYGGTSYASQSAGSGPGVTVQPDHAGKIYYCPGTPLSFGGGQGQTTGHPFNDWYNATFMGSTGHVAAGFGQPFTKTAATYYYRGGVFEKEDLPIDHPNQHYGGNWQGDDYTYTKRIDSVRVGGNKPFLTCFGGWDVERNSGNGSLTWDEINNNIPHGKRWTNFARADGSAKSLVTKGYDGGHFQALQSRYDVNCWAWNQGPDWYYSSQVWFRQPNSPAVRADQTTGSGHLFGEQQLPFFWVLLHQEVQDLPARGPGSYGTP